MHLESCHFDYGTTDLIDKLGQVHGFPILVLQAVLDDVNDLIVGVAIVVDKNEAFVAVLERVFQVWPCLHLFSSNLPVRELALPQACKVKDVFEADLDDHAGPITDIVIHFGQDFLGADSLVRQLQVRFAKRVLGKRFCITAVTIA